jgi:hypothetical protein
MRASAAPVMCDQQRSKHSLLPLPVLNGERGGVRGGAQLERLCPSPQPSPRAKSGEREPRGVRCTVMGTHER